jgi:hypothetical protein
MVWHGPIQAEKLENRANQTFGLAECQPKYRPERQHRSDRQSRVVRLAAPYRAGFGPPGGNGFLRDPDCQASPLAQGCIVLRLVCHPVPLLGDAVTASSIGFERHGRHPTWRVQDSYVSQFRLPNRLFVQHVWTPFVTQEESSGVVERVGECCHVYGLICGHSHAAGPDEVRGSGPIQGGALEARCCTLVFLIPSHRPLRHPSPSTFLRSNSPTAVSA